MDTTARRHEAEAMSGARQTQQAPDELRALLERIDVEWRALLAALNGIPTARLEELGAGGEWSPKQLMGHLAFWDAQALQEIAQLLAGQPVEDVDVHARNEADQAARAGRTLAQERAAMQQAHAALLARLASVRGDDAACLAPRLGRHTYEHYAMHTQDLQRFHHQIDV